MALTTAVTVALIPATSASADPSPTDWSRLRQCESGGNYGTNTGNAHYGAYQFDIATWGSVGGHGLPSDASAGEQDARALILYRQRGWQPWQCAGIVGLREDADARSGRINDINVPGTGSPVVPKPVTPPVSGVPAYPSSVNYRQGVTNSVVARWQLKMAGRGAPLHGSGVFGPITTAVVKAVQLQNGLPVTGELGPNTWRMAWTGKYSTKPASTPPTPPPAKPAAWPGVTFTVGDTSPIIAVWQKQLHARGVTELHGTGVFGPNTLAVVKRLQLHNGLLGTGVLGPNTWKLAWTGRL